MWDQEIEELIQGNIKTLARTISKIENDSEGYALLLKKLPLGTTPIIGITGPPGAGKSTLTDALISLLVSQNKKIGVLCVDPSSPFNFGALLGDRIRMSDWYNHPNVFIRSLATRGSLGGLHPKIIEITDVMKIAGFDYIIIETVGVGQSEIEIAGLADVTIVVLVPEAGDDIQTMKAGLMEVADVFVVNKADRPGADLFIKNLMSILTSELSGTRKQTPVVKTVASQKEGIDILLSTINEKISENITSKRKVWFYAEKAYLLIQQKRMKGVNKDELINQISQIGQTFNLYHFIDTHY